MNELNYFRFENFMKDKSSNFIADLENRPLSPKLRSAMLDLIIKCPASGSSKMGVSFSQLGLFSKTDFIQKLHEIHSILSIKYINQYIWQDVYLQDEWFEVYKELSQRKSFVYMFKARPHLETFYLSMRNAIAHGQFIIENQFLTMWTLSNQNKIKSLIHIKSNMFIKIVNILNNAYKNKG